MANKLSHR